MVRRTRTVARMLAGLLLAIAYGAVALGSGLDRMSERNAALARHVPHAFAVEAARQGARLALLRRDFPTAREQARLALARDPIEPRSVGLYGEVALLSGDREGASRAFAVAGGMGWREPFTQVYLLATALGRNDFATAALHADAILRQNPQLPQRNLVLGFLDAQPSGRFALATRLAANPAWAQGYFVDTALPDFGDPLARSEVALLLARNARQRDCGLIGPLFAGLLAHGHATRAHELYALECAAPGEPAAPADGGFERASTLHPPTALDWQFTADGTIGVSLGPVPGMRGQAVTVSSIAAFAKPFASEPLALPPGYYRIAWRATDAQAAPAPAVSVSLACTIDDRTPLPARLDDARLGRFVAIGTVPAGCPTQWLTLMIAGGAGGLSVDDVSLSVPAAAGGAASP